MNTFLRTFWSKKRALAIACISIAAMVAVGGVAFAANGFSFLSSSKGSINPPSQFDNKNKTPVNSVDNLQSKDVVQQERASNSQPPQPTASTPTQETSLSNRPATSTPTPTSSPAPAIATPSVAQTPVATCNEAMKASYTNLYNTQITAENTRWANQQDAIRADAQRRGIGFSGIVQEQIDAARPAHEANLATIENNYMQNLNSIHCL